VDLSVLSVHARPYHRHSQQFCLHRPKNRDTKDVEGNGMVSECPRPQPTRGSGGECRKLPIGVRHKTSYGAFRSLKEHIW